MCEAVHTPWVQSAESPQFDNGRGAKAECRTYPEALAGTYDVLARYLPDHFGARFSMNAVRPSL